MTCDTARKNRVNSMSSIKTYIEDKELRYSVTIGRKTFKGFRTAREALMKGVHAAVEEDNRVSALISGKPFDRQVGIVFGADVVQKYCGNE
jgi:hypothetical protein